KGQEVVASAETPSRAVTDLETLQGVEVRSPLGIRQRRSARRRTRAGPKQIASRRAGDCLRTDAQEGIGCVDQVQDCLSRSRARREVRIGIDDIAGYLPRAAHRNGGAIQQSWRG